MRCKFWQSLKKLCTWRSEQLKIFENLRCLCTPAYKNSIIRKKITVPFWKYKRLKLKLRVFLAGHSVAMVTYNVTKIIPTCSLVIGQFFDTMIVASIDKERL